MDVEITVLFSKQHGNAHVRQLHRLGMRSVEIVARERSGSWVNVDGVLSPAGLPESLPSRCWRAALAVRYRGTRERRVAIAGLAAGALLELPGVKALGDIELLCSWLLHGESLTGAQLVRTRNWTKATFTTRHGLLVANHAITSARLAALLAPEDLHAVVQHVVFHKDASIPDLLAQCGRGRLGSTALREVTVALAGGVESAAAAVAVRALTEARFHLSEPRVIAPGFGAPDFLIELRRSRPPYGLAGEIDGFVHQKSRARVAADEAKDIGTEAAGYRPRRYGAARILRDPSAFAERVAAHVDELIALPDDRPA